MNRATLLIVLVLAIPVTAGADWKPHAGLGLQVWVPDGWTEQADGDTLRYTSTDQDATAVLAALGPCTLEQASASVATTVGTVVSSPVVASGPTAVERNGLPGITWEGTGRVGTRSVAWGALLVTRNDQCLLIVTTVVPSRQTKYNTALSRVLRSVKPI
jgi:hypothetical protein